MARATDRVADLSSGVGPVHRDVGRRDALDTVRKGAEHEGDDHSLPPASEGAVVDADDPGVRFGERAPQRYTGSPAPSHAVSGPWTTIRCPRCGRFLVAPSPPTSEPAWFACPHCAQPVPVLAPRDPPPLFSWEVYPHLYPPAHPPKVPGPAVGRLLTALLVTATVVLAGLAGGLGWAGAATLAPGGFTVRGFVVQSGGSGPSVPLVGASVNMTGESRASSTTTGGDGSFSFSSVPAGGISLKVTEPGFEPVLLHLFASALYSTAGVGAPVYVGLTPGPPTANTTDVALSSFGNLDGYLTNLWSSSILLGMGAVVAAVGALAAFRERRLSYAVAGAGAAIAGPVAPGLLGVMGVFPVVGWFAALAIALGAVALGLGTVRLAALGRPPDDD
jgi:carboxypeptidase family protein